MRLSNLHLPGGELLVGDAPEYLQVSDHDEFVTHGHFGRTHDGGHEVLGGEVLQALGAEASTAEELMKVAVTPVGLVEDRG